MRVGFVVEGQGEIAPLQELFGRVGPQSQHTLVTRPLYADLQPKSSVKVIARTAQTAIQVMLARNVEKVVVMLDSEGASCPVRLAFDLNNELSNRFDNLLFSTVVKHRSFENWLIADCDGIEKLRARFRISSSFVRNVGRGRADEVQDPVALLNRIAVGSEYHKGRDPIRIVQAFDPARVAQNSRSFRKLMKEIGARL